MKASKTAFIILMAVGCTGTVSSPGPPAQPGARITGWSEDLMTVRGKELFLRNNTDQPLAITSIILYDCENVRGGCHPRDPGITLGPYEWVSVRTVRPAREDVGFYYRWRWNYSGLRQPETFQSEPSALNSSSLPDFDSYGPTLAAFEVPEDDRFGLTGQYSGRIARVGDTLIFRVDQGVIRSRLPPGRPVQHLRRIRVGVRPKTGVDEGATVTYGPRHILELDLESGDQVLVGPFELRVVPPVAGPDGIQLFFSHEILLEDDRWAYTYAYLPGDLGDVIRD